MKQHTRVRRAVRGLGLGRNPLCRRVDRMEGVVRMLTGLLAVGLTLVVAVVATTSYERAADRNAAERRQWRQVTVVLLADTAAATGSPYAPVYSQRIPVRARWTEPDGTVRTADVYSQLAGQKGDRVPIWLDASGAPVRSVTTRADLKAQAWTEALAALSLGGLLLYAGYVAARAALSRRRDAAWTAEWLVVEQRWRHNV